MKKFFIFLLVFVLLILSQTCDDNNEVNDESEFEAGITCYPDFGTKYTEFKFSISILSDTDTLENTENFQVRWDFDGDGTYDTDWIDSFSITHRFNTPGTYETEVTLKDSLGDLNESSIHVYIQEMIQITTNESGTFQGNIDWCPDGSNRIAFDWNRAEDTGWHTIWSVEYPGGTLTQITTHTSSDAFHQFPEWSPDGNKIAIRTGYLDIFNLSTNTMVHKGIIGDFPRWSPDGQWIIIAHESTILYNVSEDTVSTLLSDGTYQICWNPNGSQIAYYLRDITPNILRIMDFDSRNDINEFTIPTPGSKIDWSPNGKWIMLGFDTDDHLLILNYETGKIYTGILDGLDSKWYPTWSSDGTLIAFEAELAGGDRKNEIWAVTAPEFMR